MTARISFGQWLKQRRKALDLTREDLAGHIGCAINTLYKIEADERRPSKQIAELLAKYLNIPPDEYLAFIQFARARESDSEAPWGTPFQPPTNLTAQPTLLIGREEDVVAIGKRLHQPETRLLTLTGPPGIGKTRLALQVAADVVDDFADGIFFVALAPISDANLVAATIANTLGVPGIGPQTPLERLKSFLRDKQLLLVLDNFEQILAAAAQIAELLIVCPWLKILVTSRSPLRIRQERQFPVSALAVPDLTHLSDVENVMHYSAVTLFLERAQAVKPDFSLNQDNALTIAAICARLDGLPLAIELISARIKLLSPPALLDRLGGRLLLQSDGLRDIEPRHQTLNAAIDWSYQLLSMDEQTLFRHLGVFVGGWTLEAAGKTCMENVNLNLLDSLASLLDKNLVKQNTRLDDEPRFMMLETIREYALEQLRVNGEEQTLKQAHASYFLAFAEYAEPELRGSQYHQWLNRLQVEHDNLRTTLDWYQNHEVEQGLRLVFALRNFWTTRGYILEGSERVERILSARSTVSTLPSSLWADTLNVAARLACVRDDDRSLQRWAEEALYISQSIQDTRNMLLALRQLGQGAATRADGDEAERLWTEGLAIAREVKDDRSICHFLNMLGVLARNRRDYGQAISYHIEAMQLIQQLDDKSYVLKAKILWEVGTSWLFKQDFEQAQHYYKESLSMSHEAIEFAYCLEGFGALASAQQQPVVAARLLGAAEALRQRSETPLFKLDRYYEQFVTMTQIQLEESVFAAAWREGRAMMMEEAVTYALIH